MMRTVGNAPPHHDSSADDIDETASLSQWRAVRWSGSERRTGAGFLYR